MSSEYRTVVVEGALSKRKIEVLRELEAKYKEVLQQVVDFGLEHGITSFARLKGEVYRELRERYPDLPSHYVHTACRDAATRLKSFKKMKKKGKAKTEKPEIKRVSIWLDDHLYKQIDDFTMRVSTPKGHVFVPLNPHKLYWIYKNTGWKLASEAKLRLLDDRALVYLTFKNAAVVDSADAKGVIAIDVNENNVTVKIEDKAYILEHNIGRIVIGYSSYKQIAQAVKGDRHISRTISKNERNKKKDRRRKIARLVVREAKRRGCTIAVEDLPKNAPSHMIERIEDKRLRHRIYQAGFRDVLREIEEVAKKEGVKLIKVNPSRTSSLCPRCGGGLVRGSASRELRCPRCGFWGNRDVIAVVNIERRARRQGPVPLGPMPDDPAPEAAVLLMKAWARRKSLEDALRLNDLEVSSRDKRLCRGWNMGSGKPLGAYAVNRLESYGRALREELWRSISGAC